MDNYLVQKLDFKGEKLLQNNVSENEKIFVKLQGFYDTLNPLIKRALVITNRRLYFLEWGFMSGNQCVSYDYKNITGLDVRTGIGKGVFEILTPSRSLLGDIINARTITFLAKNSKQFQEAANIGRDFITKEQNESMSNNRTVFNELEKLAELKERGIITEDEFQAKKKQVLDL